LKDLKVLEVCTQLLGPIGPALLAQMGAQVIKCEFPPLGDSTRSLNPFGWFYKNQSPLLFHINQNKYWVGLDLHKPEAQKVFCELAAQCDIVENNFRPGVMEEWNIGYQQIREINPRIIFLSKSGLSRLSVCPQPPSSNARIGPLTPLFPPLTGFCLADKK
jgi:crotonobetainyl-CoA:carnitine CoA-transferase CaiB-like acyl-CoA transferase